jgi:Flp pilus assembly protein TadD
MEREFFVENIIYKHIAPLERKPTLLLHFQVECTSWVFIQPKTKLFLQGTPVRFMRFILSGVCFCLIVFGFAETSRAQAQLTTPAAPASANSTVSKPRSEPQPQLADIKVLLPGDPVPATTTAASAEPSLYLKGLTFLDSGQNAEAVETLLLAVERDPNDAAAYGKLGVAYATLKQYKEAVVVFKIAIRIKPAIVDAEDYYHLSRAYIALEKFSLALDAIKLALYIKRADQINAENGSLSRAPALADLHYSAGLALFNLRRYREALEELKQVVTLNPKHAPGQFGLGLTYLATGERKEAAKQQEVLEPLDPVYAAKLAKLLATRSDDPQGFAFTFKVNP